MFGNDACLSTPGVFAAIWRSVLRRGCSTWYMACKRTRFLAHAPGFPLRTYCHSSMVLRVTCGSALLFSPATRRHIRVKQTRLALEMLMHRRAVDGAATAPLRILAEQQEQEGFPNVLPSPPTGLRPR